MLQHPNIKTKHMEVIYRRCFTKEEHWATAKSHHNRFKQAWRKCKKYQVGHGINSITKQCSEQVINMLQELIIAKQGMAWIYSKHRSKVPYWPWAKKDQKIWWHPCKHSKLYYRFIHGRNRIMKACKWACTTHHRSMHGMKRNPTVRRHNYEAKHGNSMVIGCMDH